MAEVDVEPGGAEVRQRAPDRATDAVLRLEAP